MYNTWVENAYAAADENSPLYVTLHHIFFILSRAKLRSAPIVLLDLRQTNSIIWHILSKNRTFG